MQLLTSNQTCRTGTSEKKSIILQTKNLFNEITHKISSCFLKNHWRSKFRLRELKKIRKNWVERRTRVDKNLSLNLRSFFFGLVFYSKWPRLIFRVGLKMICHVSWVFYIYMLKIITSITNIFNELVKTIISNVNEVRVQKFQSSLTFFICIFFERYIGQRGKCKNNLYSSLSFLSTQTYFGIYL